MGRIQTALDAVHLVDLLEKNVQTQPQETCLIFEEKEWAYRVVSQKADAFAQTLLHLGLKAQEKVAIILDNRPDYFSVFFGILKAAGIVVSISPKSKDNRVVDILQHSESYAVVAPSDYWNSHPLVRTEVEKNGVRVLTLEDIDWSLELKTEVPRSDASEPAFFQYTSGTTGFSKGVIVSHRAAIANLKSMFERFPVDPEKDVFSSMMPLYHDMGLVGFGLFSFFTSAVIVLFLQDIRNIYGWLESFSRYKATISGASNTMLYLTRRVVSDPSEYDLSNLRVLLCGSEPLFHPTLQNFETDFRTGPVLVPAYGLAEATLCLTMSAPGKPYVVDAKGIVSCGRALHDVELKIGNPDASGVGEVWAKSPALMDGYYKRDHENDELFVDGYLRTGDLGYIDSDGELFLLGRKKNIIIRDGENLLPGELEEIALRHADVRNACVVGVSNASKNQREDIVLIAEIKQGLLKKPESLGDLKKSIVEKAKVHCNYLPDFVAFVPPVTIPFSPNGKLQHQAMKALYLSPQWNEIEKVVI